MMQMMMAITSAVSCFISERMDGKTGVTSLFSFLLIVLFSIAYERFLDLNFLQYFFLLFLFIMLRFEGSNVSVVFFFFYQFKILIFRTFNDMRLYMIIHIAPFVTIPVLALLFPPKYTLSRYWFWAIGMDLACLCSL